MPRDDTDVVEVEWQFEAPDLGWVETWLRQGDLGGFAAEDEGSQLIVDVYVDTPDWRIHRAGFAARLRRLHQRSELTLKSLATGDTGPRQRREISSATSGSSLDELARAGGSAADLLRAIAGNSDVQMLFEIQTRRQLFGLRNGGSERVGEIALDRTSIRRERRPVLMLSRVEVEVCGAGARACERFVERAAVATELHPALCSKLGAAMEAIGARPFGPEASLGEARTVAPRMTVAEAVFAAVREQFAVALANEPGTRAGLDPEALHDMRVAARRIRALLRAFRAPVGPRLGRFEGEMQWLARELGEVRDLDVQLERYRGWMADLPEDEREATRPVLEIASRRREEARRRMLISLDSSRYTELVAGLSDTLRRGIDGGFGQGGEPVVRAIPPHVFEALAKLERRGDAIGPGSPPEDLHAVRRHARRVRYLLDFAEPLYGKAARRYRRRLVDLQRVLGDYQDAQVNEAMVRSMVEEPGIEGQSLFVLGRLAERNRATANSKRGEFGQAWKRLAGKARRRIEDELKRAAEPGS